MPDENERMQVLNMIENGQISAEEGLQLLQSLSGELDEPDEAPAETIIERGDQIDQAAVPTILEADYGADKEPPADTPEEPSQELYSESVHEPEGSLPGMAHKWRQWWMLPLWIGIAITLSGGFLMYWAQKDAGIGLGFICAGVPFLIGIVVIVLAWQSRSAPWLHLRIQQAPGERPQRIAFSFPLPIRITAWFLRTFGKRIPQLEETSLDEVIMAVGESTSPENPIYIQVDEGEDGEKVEIFIG